MSVEVLTAASAGPVRHFAARGRKARNALSATSASPNAARASKYTTARSSPDGESARSAAARTAGHAMREPREAPVVGIGGARAVRKLEGDEMDEDLPREARLGGRRSPAREERAGGLDEGRPGRDLGPGDGPRTRVLDRQRRQERHPSIEEARDRRQIVRGPDPNEDLRRGGSRPGVARLGEERGHAFAYPRRERSGEGRTAQKLCRWAAASASGATAGTVDEEREARGGARWPRPRLCVAEESASIALGSSMERRPSTASSSPCASASMRAGT